MTAQPSIPALAVSTARPRACTRAEEQWHLLKAGLVVLDGLALSAAFALAYVLRFKTGMPLFETLPERVDFYFGVTFWAVPVWLAIFALYRLYDRHYLFAGLQEYSQAINACTAGTFAVIVISFLDVNLVISRGWLLVTWLLSVSLVICCRFAARRLIRHLRRRGLFTTPTVIVGANEEARALAEQFLGDPGSGIQLIGFVDGSVGSGTEMVGALPVLGGLDTLEDIVHQRRATQIVVATTALSRPQLLDLFRTLGHDNGVELRLSSGLFEVLTTGVKVQEISYVPLMTPQRVRITGIDAVLKAALDYSVALAGLLAMAPLLLVIALLIKVDSPGPVLHRRRVLGRGDTHFDAFKFRTMVVNADEVLASNAGLREAFEKGQKLKDDPRVTRLGRFLRRSSLDELPQLINVLRGQMSLVGPRMIAPDEATRYGKWRLNLLTVKPGITGPWQVFGRNDIPYEERVRLSMQYIRNYTIWLDLAILFRTLPAVLQARGAY